MNIDRIAAAMTGGRPRADFTARVMAPIYGRPRPGFTGRVMAQTAAPDARRAHRPAMVAALLIPAGLAIVAGLMAVRASRVDLPAAPVAPRLATGPVFNPAMETAPRVTHASPVSQHRPVTRAAQAVSPAANVMAPPEPSPIYVIPALEGPADIALKSIEPPAFTVPALDAPAPLKVADLKSFKEKP